MTKPLKYLLCSCAIFALALFASSASALQPLAAIGGLPGPELNMLQRMQGRWHRQCYTSVEGQTRVYQRDFLTVSFTHFSFHSKIYTDDACKVQRTEYKAKTRFILTGEQAPKRGIDQTRVTAFAIDLESVLPAVFAAPRSNIVALQAGKLMFGRDYSGESEKGLRLTQLAIRAPYLRR